MHRLKNIRFWIQLGRWINEKCQHVLNFSLSESLIIVGTTNNVYVLILYST